MDLLQKFKEFIKKQTLFQPTDHLLVAVSGGVDSIVLCELCKRSNYQFSIAHCNFQLRAEESNRDEQFVRDLADFYKVPFLLNTFDTQSYAKENRISIQVAARTLRYTWFHQLLQNNDDNGEHIQINKYLHQSDKNKLLSKPKYLLTAHHADDNIETLLMNFFKGTGITGLRGILPKQEKIIRPLLFASKKMILDFTKDNKLDYVEDSSNESNKYTRNYFRNELIPSIQKVFPAVEENLAENLNRFREIEQLYQQSVQWHHKKLVETKGKEIHIPILKLKKSVPLLTIIYEITRHYGFTAHQSYDILDLLDSESGKYIQSLDYRIIKNRNWLIISPMQTSDAQTIIINKTDKKLVFEKGSLAFKELPVDHCQRSASPQIAQLDAAEIAYPIILRKRKQSDYFYPLGMQKKKKLNRFLSDEKLSVTEKEHVWLLEVDKKIIWITGRRIDDRFKITAKTTNVLQVSFTPGG